MDTTAEEWLSREDDVARSGRLARLRWLASLPISSDYVVFAGGYTAKALYEESRYGYVYGQFLSCVLCASAAIEVTLASHFYASGRNDAAKKTFKNLLRDARADNLLNGQDIELLQRIRKLRNPLTHFRRPLHPSTLPHRSVTSDLNLEEVKEIDARRALKALYRLINAIPL